MKTIVIYFLVFLTLITFLSLPNSFAQEGMPKYVVRTVYFVPNDLLPDPNMEDDLRTLMKDVQKFYADEIERHGFGRKTFRLETDETGKVVVHRVIGQFDTSHYYFAAHAAIEFEINKRFDDISKNIYMTSVATENGLNCYGIGSGVNTNWTAHEGVSYTHHKGATHNGSCGPPRDFFGVTLHELGHAFSLPHDFRTAGIMSYGYKDLPLSLSKCAAEWLDVHRYFNEQSSDIKNARTRIEYLPILAYPPNAVILRFELSDPDGLHQARIIGYSKNYTNRSGPGLIACKSLNGTSATVEFITTELGPVGTGKADMILNVMDKHGNYTNDPIPFSEEDIQAFRAADKSQVDINSDGIVNANDRIPADILKISGDNQQGLPNDWLPEPFVVRVVDATGAPVVGVEVIFRVTPYPPENQDLEWLRSDYGLLSNTESRTDADGRAQTFLFLGYQVETHEPVVHVSVAGVSKQIRFNAMAREKVLIDPSEYPNIYWVDAIDNHLYGPEGSEWVHAVQVQSIAYDGRNRQMYWIEGLLSMGNYCAAIKSTTLDGPFSPHPHIEVATFMNMPVSLAIHPLQSKLYWTNNRGEIQTCNLDGSNIENLITGLDSPKHITIDTARSKLYWTDGQERILSADLNGKNIQTFLRSPQTLGHITVAGDHLYWSEKISETEGVIRGADLKQHRLKVLYRLDSVPVGLAVDLASEKLYWTDTQGRIRRANLNGSQIEDVIIGLLVPGSIVLDIPHTMEESLPAAPPPLAADVNADGTVNIQDLVQVAANFGETGENAADVNGDGQVNIQDLVAVAAAFGEAAAAPAAHATIVENLTATEVKHYLHAAQHANLTDPTFQRGVEVLKHLLALLTPKETALLPNYPNPFNPETWIPYQLATPAEVAIRIYAVDGSLVRVLSLGHKTTGIYQTRTRAAYWDGRNNLGEPVASGLYFYTLTAGDFTATRKMVVRK